MGMPIRSYHDMKAALMGTSRPPDVGPLMDSLEYRRMLATGWLSQRALYQGEM